MGVAFVVFQNLLNLEMLLPIFIFLIRRLVKKLFNFEVRYINGVYVVYVTSIQWLAAGAEKKRLCFEKNSKFIFIFFKNFKLEVCDL